MGGRDEAPVILHSRDGFAAFVSGLPGTSLNEQWESLVAKVGGKVFGLRGESGGLVFKVTEVGFAGLTSLPDIRQAAYFAKGQWVHVGPEAPLSDDELKAYLRASHRMIAARLTRRVKAELGLDDALG